MKKTGPSILWVPDTQIKPGVPIDHIRWLARLVAERRPDRVVFGGDWWDMEALSSYDKGKRSAEGKRVKADVESGNVAMDLYQAEKKKRAPRSYAPDEFFIYGNHENRIHVATQNDPALEGVLSFDMLALKKHGIYEVPFLKPIDIDGVTFIHYCPLGPNGRVSASRFGAPSARVQIQRMMRSTVCGHRQGKDVAELYTPGRIIRGVIAGSFYQHQEGYLTPTGETYWRGVLLLNNVRVHGNFDLEEISIETLEENFG